MRSIPSQLEVVIAWRQFNALLDRLSGASGQVLMTAFPYTNRAYYQSSIGSPYVAAASGQSIGIKF